MTHLWVTHRVRTGQDSDPATPEALLAAKRAASGELEAELAQLRGEERRLQRHLDAAERERKDAPSDWLLLPGYGALALGIFLLRHGDELGWVLAAAGVALLLYHGTFGHWAEKDYQEATSGLLQEFHLVRRKIRDTREELDRL